MANGVDLEMSAWAAAVDARVQALEQRWQVFLALVMLNLVDVVTTGFVLDRGGSEGNPFIEPIVDNLVYVSLLKGVILAFVGALLIRCEESKLINVSLTMVTGWYVAVVGWNLAVLFFI